MVWPSRMFTVEYSNGACQEQGWRECVNRGEESSGDGRDCEKFSFPGVLFQKQDQGLTFLRVIVVEAHVIVRDELVGIGKPLI
jgi:hypothetical protein